MNETKPSRAVARAVMLSLTALCLATVGLAAVPSAAATPILPPVARQCVYTSGVIAYGLCLETGPGPD